MFVIKKYAIIEILEPSSKKSFDSIYKWSKFL